MITTQAPDFCRDDQLFKKGESCHILKKLSNEVEPMQMVCAFVKKRLVNSKN